MNEEKIKEALKAIKYPGFSRDIVSFGLLKGVAVDGGKVTVSLALTTTNPKVPAELKAECEQVLSKLDGVSAVEVTVAVKTPPKEATAQDETESILQDVRFTVAVASGKGGVGKSTFTTNLACAFDRIYRERGREARVGIMDCDIYGPSIPLMLGVSGRPEIQDSLIQPLENFGIRVMSMGLLVDENTPVIWRGPMVMKTIQQFAQNVNWGELDILLIDLPPGTGDAQLSLVQTIPLDGAIVVTTPQTAAVNVAKRGAVMFEKVSVPLLGVAENMSYLPTADGGRQYIFGSGGGARTATELGTAFLGQVPLDQRIREGCDRGIPIVISDPDTEAALAFQKIAATVDSALTASGR